MVAMQAETGRQREEVGARRCAYARAELDWCGEDMTTEAMARKLAALSDAECAAVTVCAEWGKVGVWRALTRARLRCNDNKLQALPDLSRCGNLIE